MVSNDSPGFRYYRYLVVIIILVTLITASARYTSPDPLEARCQPPRFSTRSGDPVYVPSLPPLPTLSARRQRK